MADEEEELSPEQKLALAKNFILNSPPAQAKRVVEDVRTLVGADLLTSSQEEAILRALNKEQYAAVDVPGGGKVLLTQHGELPNGTFLDPSSKQCLTVNHTALTCSAQPMDSAQLAELAQAEPHRGSIDAAMRRHVDEWLPNGTVTTYGGAVGGVKITCCVASLAHDLSNYWAGRWWAEWTLQSGGGSMGALTGKIKCNVHYFEDGNVQLEDEIKFQGEVPLGGDVGEAFAKQVKIWETEFTAKLEDIYTSLSEQVLQSLRRRLPITRTKFDWEKHTVAKLAMDLQNQAIQR